MNKRIAISANDNQGLESAVSNHFGRCPYFIIAEIEENTIKSVEVIENPFFHSHRPGQVPGFIHSHNVNVMLTGGMGHRAVDFFLQYGIQPVTGAAGTVQQTLDRYLNGEISEAQPCAESQSHRDGRHQHGHHH
jgi:predicted Fe-Mo cluster-binding NifX family protein